MPGFEKRKKNETNKNKEQGYFFHIDFWKVYTGNKQQLQ